MGFDFVIAGSGATGPASSQSRIGGYASPATGGRDASENDDYRVPEFQRRVPAECNFSWQYFVQLPRPAADEAKLQGHCCI